MWQAPFRPHLDVLGIRMTLSFGDFTIDVDGRTFADPDAVVVCERSADVRFFVSKRRRGALNRR